MALTPKRAEAEVREERKRLRRLSRGKLEAEAREVGVDRPHNYRVGELRDTVLARMLTRRATTERERVVYAEAMR
jgi:hypothetical protein